MRTFLRGTRPVAVVLSAALLFAAGAADDGSVGDLTVRAEAPASVRADAPAEPAMSEAGGHDAEGGGHDDAEGGGHDAESGGHDAHG